MTLKILTFDTGSANKMFVTIGENSHVKSFRIVESTKEKYNSALLIPTIIELLNEQNLTMQDIDAVGVNIGPGSFTGIRASAVVARIIGQNLNIPIIGVSSLQMLSFINTTNKSCLCVMDARKNKAYVGFYSHDNAEIEKPHTLEYDHLIQKIKNNEYISLGSIIADKIMTQKLNEAGLECINFEKVDKNFGISLIKLTYEHLQQKSIENYKWYNLKPLYLQPPPITMPKK